MGIALALQTVQPLQPGPPLLNMKSIFTASYPIFPGMNWQNMIMNTLNTKLRD